MCRKESSVPNPTFRTYLHGLINYVRPLVILFYFILFYSIFRFGYIVAATAYGKVFGIDSSNGDIPWSRVLGYGWAAEIGVRIIPVMFFVTKMAWDGSNPEALSFIYTHLLGRMQGMCHVMVMCSKVLTSSPVRFSGRSY